MRYSYDCAMAMPPPMPAPPSFHPRPAPRSCTPMSTFSPPNSSPTSSAPEGDWKCVHCGNVNFGFRYKCNLCAAANPNGEEKCTNDAKHVCPYTVMLVRVPCPATEKHVAASLFKFGELAQNGIQFTKSKSKEKFLFMPPNELAIHAFCKFVHPQSAKAAIEYGEVIILGKRIRVSHAFTRHPVMPPADISFTEPPSYSATAPAFPAAAPSIP